MNSTHVTPTLNILVVHGVATRHSDLEQLREQVKNGIEDAGVSFEKLEAPLWGSIGGTHEFAGISLPFASTSNELEEGFSYAAMAQLQAEIIADDPRLSTESPYVGDQQKYYQAFCEELDSAIGHQTPSLNLKLKNSLAIAMTDDFVYSIHLHGVALERHLAVVLTHIYLQGINISATNPDYFKEFNTFQNLCYNLLRKHLSFSSAVTRGGMQALGKKIRSHIQQHFSEKIIHSLIREKALFMSDLLGYLGNPEPIREIILGNLKTLLHSHNNVMVIAHSLGGVIIADILLRNSAELHALIGQRQLHLITIGSQIGLLAEIGYFSLNLPRIPIFSLIHWSNYYDPSDYLSSKVSSFFTNVKDFRIESGTAFPSSHSSYFANPKLYEYIATHLS